MFTLVVKKLRKLRSKVLIKSKGGPENSLGGRSAVMGSLRAVTRVIADS